MKQSRVTTKTMMTMMMMINCECILSLSISSPPTTGILISKMVQMLQNVTDGGTGFKLRYLLSTRASLD